MKKRDSRAAIRNDTTTRRPAKLRGRRRRNPTLAQDTILQVAREHFVSHGLSGGRIDEIAAASGYSKAMIYHYYGSKEFLYRAVLEDAYRRDITPRKDIDIDAVGPVVALERFVRDGADAIRKDPSILNLLAIENLHHAKHLEGSALPTTTYITLKHQLQHVLNEGVRRGVFRDGLDVTTLYLLLSSIIFHAVSNRHTLSIILDTDITSDSFMSRYVDSAVDMVVRYCLKAPPVP
ncbi:MAG: TetR family transcriptional regulator [Afipia sp.]